MNSFYILLADLVLLAHVAYVGFVVVGLLLIAVGGLLRWQWVRHFWFRLVHLVMMLIVAVETVFAVTCPLTTWENDLRTLASQETVEGDIIAHWLQAVLFFTWPEWVFTALYYGFTALIFVAFVLVPPRWPGRNRTTGSVISPSSAPPGSSQSPAA